MSRAEFMRQLEQLLSDIPQSERAEALNYYEEYFSDAGVENEQKVLMELGSPWQVAQNIRDGLQTEIPIGNAYDAQEKQENIRQEEKGGLPTWAIVLIVIGCIFGSPLILGLALALIGLFIGLLGVIIGVGAAGAALVVAGIAVFVAGIMNCALFPMAGIALAGAGLVIFAVGILCIMLVVWLCGFLLPAICRGMASLFKRKNN